MSIDRLNLGLAVLLVAGLWVAGPGRTAAKTVEVEVEEEDVQAVENPKSEPAKPAKAAPAAVPVKPVKAAPAAAAPVKTPTSAPVAAVEVSPESSMPRTRVGDKVGMYYFIKSGFVVPDESKPAAAALVKGFTMDMHYSTPKTCYIEFSNAKSAAAKGDLLVVYRVATMIREPHSGFSGFWVRNLAIVKVLEVDKKRCLVEVRRSFFPFERGDKVRYYDDEMDRWKQAQTKKSLPDHPIKCYVVSVETDHQLLNQSDPIVLTAGSKKGVVEGQVFELREGKGTGLLEPRIHIPTATARVFYVGGDYSMAQILSNHVPVENGFEAHYQP